MLIKYFNGYIINYLISILVRASKSNVESQEYQEAIAIYSRIKFYRHFFQALSFLTKQDLTNGLKHISCAKEQIPTMAETSKIGIGMN